MWAPDQRRTVITGVGVISPLGNHPEILYESLMAQQSGISTLPETADAHVSVKYGGQAGDFTGVIDDYGPLEREQKKVIRKGIKIMCREIQMGVAAAQRALADAGLKPGQYDSAQTGVVFGADYMMTRPEDFVDGIRACMDDRRQFNFADWSQSGLPKVTPLWLLKYLPNMPASHIAIYNDLQGPSNSITHREASSNLAISEARGTIARGAADVMVAGATGSRIQPMRTVHVATQEQLATNGVDPEKMSRPFDQNRTGMVVGEGAGAVVLEDLDRAKSRGATIYGEIVGSASSSVVTRGCVGQTGKAIENVIQGALHSAGASPDDIGHVHAHGASTSRGDVEEAQAICSTLGDRSSPVPVTTMKGHIGNLGAGSGTVELIASLMAMRADKLFPVLNYETADPECPVAVVRPGDSPSPGSSVLNVNVTPQGQASALLIRSWS